MIYKESTGELFTQAGVFIKRIHCPKGSRALGLLHVDRTGRLGCLGCSRRIVDVRRMSEQGVVDLVAADPKVCLLLDHAQLSLR